VCVRLYVYVYASPSNRDRGIRIAITRYDSLYSIYHVEYRFKRVHTYLRYFDDLYLIVDGFFGRILSQLSRITTSALALSYSLLLVIVTDNIDLWSCL